MKIVFFGTSDYVLPVLEALQKKVKRENGEPPVVAVVTKRPTPDQNKKMIYSEVDYWAHKRHLPKFYSSGEFLESGLSADLGVLAAYNEFIPNSVIAGFKYGILNIHPSLLPKYRGASPVPATIAMGDQIGGVSIIRLDSQLDHGDIITAFKDNVLPNDTYQTFRDRLFSRASEVLVEMLPAYVSGKIHPKPQPDEGENITRELTRQDGFIPQEVLQSAITGKKPAVNFHIPFVKDSLITPDAEFIVRYLRALTPWPGIWTQVQLEPNTNKETRFKILEVEAKEGKLMLAKVQLEGKNPVSFTQFTQGYPQNSLTG